VTMVLPSYYPTIDNPIDLISVFDRDLGGQYSPLYDVWDGMDIVKGQYQDFQDIYLNGVSVGSGRVKKIAFPQSRDPRFSTYEAEIELYKEGDLYNLTGVNYQNVSFDPLFAKYVSNFGEDFSFNTDRDGVISYDRSLSFSCVNPNLTDPALVSGVKSFASGIIFKDPAFQATLKSYPDFYEQEGSRYFSETYDNLLGSYSFSERFQGPTSGEYYRWSNNLSLSLQGEGPSTVSAYGGMSEVEGSSLTRVNDFYSAYNGSGTCSGNLFLKSKSRSINEEAGSIEYTFQYSSDPFSNGCYIVTRDIQMSKSEGGLHTLSEKGSVKNVCEPTPSGKLTKSIEYFNSDISGGVYGRLFDYYSGQVTGCGCPNTGDSGFHQELRKTNSEFGYSEFNGLFDYSFVYRDDCTSLTDGCFFVTQEKVTNKPLKGVSFVITPFDGELAFSKNPNQIGTYQQTIGVVSQCTGKLIEDYLDVAIARMSPPIVNSGYFLNSANYTFDPDNSKLVLNVEYNYDTIPPIGYNV